MSEKRISERILKIPALYLIKENPGISTTDLKEILNMLFCPTGKDLEIAKNRKDTFFDQKVRNLKSHDSLTEYTSYSKENGWNIISDGKIFMVDNEDLITSINSVLSDTSFSYFDKIDFIDNAIVDLFPRRKSKVKVSKSKKSKKVFYYDENETIKEEGDTKYRHVKVRERSTKLRNAAVEFYTKEGKIVCDICGFDFSKVYNGLGQGYIEIHHKKPIYQYESDDEEVVIKDAIKNLAPVCANCHRMLHRKKSILFEEVVDIYNKQKKK
ncbi:MAG: HNH endonuclease [Candidatus Izemoplasmatales bacterium]